MRRVVAILATTGALVWAGEALACACCAEPGTWYETKSPLRPDERTELGKLRSGTGRRMASPEGRSFTSFPVRMTLTGRRWQWRAGPNYHLPFLSFQLPLSATTFAADIHDGKLGGGGGPLLYKELRLEGSLTANFTALQGTHYRLVLQGRGNNCLNAADFRSWHLDIIGGKQNYELYGTFR